MDANSLFNAVMGKAGYGIDQAVQTAKSAGSGGIPGGVVGGVAAGGLAALLLTNKKSRKMGKTALKYGGAAALGGLAYKAWNDYKSGQEAAQNTAQSTSQHTQPATPTPTAVPAPPSGSIFGLAKGPESAMGEDMRLSMIRAMISAAKADGHIDGEEQARIEERIAALNLGAAEKDFLVKQLHAESDPIEIARLANCDEQAAELYLASTLAIDVDTPQESQYLQRLGDALRLPIALRQRLDAEASAL